MRDVRLKVIHEVDTLEIDVPGAYRKAFVPHYS